MRARVVAAAAGVCLVAVAFALLAAERTSRARGERRGADAPPEAPPEAAATGNPSPATPAEVSPYAERAAALQAALEGGGPAAQDAAAELRRLLRTDEASREAAEAALLDPATPRDLRMALALVLGTIGASDGVLLDALARFGDDAAFVRCALLALGAAREPADEDDVFDLGDRPFGEGGPGGIGITVNREIGDAKVRAAIVPYLAGPDAAVRRAAAVTLRATAERLDVRDAFLEVLRAEADDGVAGVVGETLAQWAGGAREQGERSRVVDALLRRAGDEGLDGFRFRLEDEFSRIPLETSGRMVLVGLARLPYPLGIRSFAMSALAASAGRFGGVTLTVTRELLGEQLDGDADAAIRDAAAQLLGRLPADAASIARLVRTSSEDPEWRVRYAAVEALAKADGRVAATAVRAAASDSDERVAERARELAR